MVTVFSTYLGTFAKLWKATISFAMSVHLHEIAWLPLDGFSLNLTWVFFRKSVEKVKVLKSDKNNGYFTWRPMISHWILLRMRNISGRSCKENQNTFFMLNKIFWKLCCLWDNGEKCGTAREPTCDSILCRRRDARIQIYTKYTLVLCYMYLACLVIECISDVMYVCLQK